MPTRAIGPRVLLCVPDLPTRVFLADNLTADGFAVHATTAVADARTLRRRGAYAAAIVAAEQALDLLDDKHAGVPTLVLGRLERLPEPVVASTLLDSLPVPFSYVELRRRLRGLVAP